MKKESIFRLMKRKMTGEATQEELAGLQELLKNDPEMNYVAETFSRLWNSLPDQKKQDHNDAQAGLQPDQL